MLDRQSVRIVAPHTFDFGKEAGIGITREIGMEPDPARHWPAVVVSQLDPDVKGGFGELKDLSRGVGEWPAICGMPIFGCKPVGASRDDSPG
jgi:hypothetical protein